ncbi:MAG: hypothetical protein Q7S74_00790 [Nanoarchaeota archaeon]|nr:hypothetical protein [Nanoarchaeota archaeon]
MKKGLIFSIVICLIILSSFATDLDPSSAAVSGGNTSGNGSITGLKDISGNLSTVSSGFADSTNKVLEQNVVIPEGLQIAAKIIFGLREVDKIELQTFVILIALWIAVFAFIMSVVRIIPTFDKPIKALVVSAIVTTLIALTGAIRFMAVLLFSFGSFFGLFEKYVLLRLFLMIILLVAFLFVVLKLTKKLKKQEGVLSAEKVGQNIGFAGEIGKIERETFSDND